MTHQQEYCFELCVAEEEVYRLDKDHKLSPELLHSFQEITKIALMNFVENDDFHGFCLPPNFSIKWVTDRHHEAIKQFITRCLVVHHSIEVVYSSATKTINIAINSL